MNDEEYWNNYSEQDRGKELLTITVEIGNGEWENIVIFEKDTAHAVAEEFCHRYFLGPELKAEFTK